MTDNSLPAQVLDNLTTAVLVLDTSLRLELISPAAQALLELSENRGLGERIDTLFNGQLDFIWTSHQEEPPQGPYTNRGLSLEASSGDSIIVDCTVSPMMDGEREHRALIVELHPVDRIRRISREEGILTSQENTQALIRGLAHEIKNPLGGLRGAAQLLARELPDPALEEYTRIIIEESDRLRSLVDRLLSPHQQPRLSEINIHEVLEHIRTLEQAETVGEVRFVRDYDPSLPSLRGDRSQLIQAVLNIVRNAIQATADIEGERVITLRTRAQRQFTIGTRRYRLVIRVDVVDNGPGIAPELRDSLFIPMVSGRPDGSGLGLSISQSIINRHGGLIECRSEPGKTEFNLYLPLDINHAAN
ncbi:MAG: nitrogen regulation protein NR(II) [Halieaceae bacterium]|jgi:two-component system nitrogen regulation sensor histidine kinase GlnL|nr:nitrogen regulation protein NR(II) [Halieaceae bacterium]